MTRELFHDGLDSQKEFERIVDVAVDLLGRQRKKKTKCVEELARIGVKAVGPILFMVEEDASLDNEHPEDYDNFNEACLEAVRWIGKPALPILEKYIEEDDAHYEVNIFAQEAVFAVLELDEEQRKKVCKHREVLGMMDKGASIGKRRNNKKLRLTIEAFIKNIFRTSNYARILKEKHEGLLHIPAMQT